MNIIIFSLGYKVCYILRILIFYKKKRKTKIFFLNYKVLNDKILNDKVLNDKKYNLRNA